MSTSLDGSVDLRVHIPHAIHCGDRPMAGAAQRVRAGLQAGGLRDSSRRARRKKGLGEFKQEM